MRLLHSCENRYQYLGCAESVPLSQRMAEIERRVAELEAKEKVEAK